jgi:hypothetical protein
MREAIRGESKRLSAAVTGRALLRGARLCADSNRALLGERVMAKRSTAADHGGRDAADKLRACVPNWGLPSVGRWTVGQLATFKMF